MAISKKKETTSSAPTTFDNSNQIGVSSHDKPIGFISLFEGTKEDFMKDLEASNLTPEDSIYFSKGGKGKNGQAYYKALLERTENNVQVVGTYFPKKGLTDQDLKDLKESFGFSYTAGIRSATDEEIEAAF